MHQETKEVINVIIADEFFLTNSIYNIRWVKSFGDKTHYGNSAVKKIYNHIIQTILE
jgi:hypothetical protein